MSEFPNARGRAPRNGEKSVRVGTHLHCMQILSDAINPLYGIEHGMGLSSTQWLHKKNLQVLLSYEDNGNWRTCNPCSNTHVIVAYEGIDKFVELVKATIPDLQRTICLVDGPGAQRVDMFVALIRLGAPAIAFHDAETLVPEDLARIKEVEKESGYFIRQHMGTSPETIICSKEPLELGSEFVTL
jgi:hypothetical protein